MTTDEFVTALRKYAGDSAIRIVLDDLLHASGRTPPKSMVEESAWYAALSPRDQEFVQRAAGRAMDATLFGIFCILDGVRAIEHGPEKGELRVMYRKKGTEIELSDPNEDLHDIYRRLFPFK